MVLCDVWHRICSVFYRSLTNSLASWPESSGSRTRNSWNKKSNGVFAMTALRIGFYLMWDKGSLSTESTNVVGDELYAESLAKAMRNSGKVGAAEVYAPNYLPTEPLDVMIYMNNTPPEPRWARKHFLYMQNAYGEGSELALRKFHTVGYDGYAFISARLLRLHQQAGQQGIFLPFGVDLSVFSPRVPDLNFEFDVAYVGNDIKGEARTTAYLVPGLKFNFGLFGNWKIPRARYRIWRNWRRRPAYAYKFEKLSRGKIPQEKVPVLYSSARINLNCTAQDCVDWDVITLRTFEVLACKGFLITDRVPSAERELEGCVAFTDGHADLTAKIEHYLAHERERREIAEAGYNYVCRFASVEARCLELLEYLERIA